MEREERAERQERETSQVPGTSTVAAQSTIVRRWSDAACESRSSPRRCFLIFMLPNPGPAMFQSWHLLIEPPPLT
jgi:hypothetical protein